MKALTMKEMENTQGGSLLIGALVFAICAVASYLIVREQIVE